MGRRPGFTDWLLTERAGTRLARFAEEDAGCWPRSYGSQGCADQHHRDKLEQHIRSRHGIVLASHQIFWDIDEAWEAWKKVKGRKYTVAQTFRQWLEQFEAEDTRLGFYARHWRAVTPGRISSPQGIEAHMLRHKRGLEEAGAADPAAGDQHVAWKNAVMALEIHPEAVKAYDERPDRPRPKNEGGATVTAFPGVQIGPAAVYGPDGSIQEGLPVAQPEAVRPAPANMPLDQGDPQEVPVKGSFTSLYTTQQRFERIESRLGSIEATLRLILDIVAGPEVAGVAEEIRQVAVEIEDSRRQQPYQQWAWPFDWDRLYTLADFTHADE